MLPFEDTCTRCYSAWKLSSFAMRTTTQCNMIGRTMWKVWQTYTEESATGALQIEEHITLKTK